MEISTTQLLIIAIVWIHFISDFVLQSTYMATHKAKYINVLFKHASIYTIPFLLFGIKYAVINGVLHFVIDYFSSAMTSSFYKRDKMRHFWLTIGCDQAIHMTCLILTMQYINLWF